MIEEARILIVGMGRAGRRHALILNKMGIPWNYVDPVMPVTEMPPHTGRLTLGLDTVGTPPSIEEIVKGSIGDLSRYDLAIVCTPPGVHLAHVRLLLDAGIPKVLCEKPLCGLGQIKQARELAGKAGDRVCVAYNWRWHPHVIHLQSQASPVELVHLYSSQYRPELPSWGLLLDHVAHGVDTLRFIVGGNRPHVELAAHKKVSFSDAFGGPGDLPGLESWTVQGTVDGCRFVIDEVVWLNEAAPPRQCFVAIDHVRHDLDTSPETLEMMFGWMWRDVLTWVDEDLERPWVTMVDGLETQAVLEKAHELNEEASKK